jgi:hypothetical protein
MRGRDRTLLLKSGDAILVVDRDDAEAVGVADRHLDSRQRDARAALLMEPQHPRVVHLVHMVAGQDDQALGPFPDD